MADKGYKYRDILNYYYKNVKILQINSRLVAANKKNEK